MTASLVFAVMLLLVMLIDLSQSPICMDCGKMLMHAEDCPNKK